MASLFVSNVGSFPLITKWKAVFRWLHYLFRMLEVSLLLQNGKQSSDGFIICFECWKFPSYYKMERSLPMASFFLSNVGSFPLITKWKGVFRWLHSFFRM